MRFERHGGAPDLPSIFARFIESVLGGRSLDASFDKESAEGQFPDFSCWRDLVLIEMKHLETDQTDRLNAVFDEKVDDADRPMFYGSRDASLVFDKLENAEEIKRAVFSKLTRTIESILSKANRQFGSYRERHPRKNAVNICLLLNSKLLEYSPEVVVRAIHAKMGAAQSDGTRFPSIDVVLYISEKHFQKLPDGRPAHPIAIYEANGAVIHTWKVDVVHRLVRAWSEYRTGGSAVHREGLAGFSGVEDIPERMKRYELWQLEYDRNPYLSGLSIQQFRVHFHRVLALNSLGLMKGSWPKPSQDEMMENMRRFQHAIAETNRRGIDMRETDPRLLSTAELDGIFGDLPEELGNMLRPDRRRGPDGKKGAT